MSHNGWTNYETWVTNLWIDGDEYVTEIANGSGEVWARVEALKEYVSENYLGDDAVASLATDLLNAAMSEVNWREIIESRKEESE